ncbi:hypothetical protein MPTK1_8g02200 [Marchantia polymorpha subsp. ruderalis]|uniref:Uncharacterized protein n=1 Tax=Marchantia polymorpha TaxID=3197 RepID=A0A2R6XIZ2_MARPO|nr:hypothetical protein MARPO_0012s0017 [Marchantia polymorpha]BBN18405.1 hypothetical protein Mp_8g02200 [Marchantia polymorpha subsp. ruderalis]|eukprot:PTQ46052.1 hypothetical protein MARPO_0012s0017 [Marchantia polymorpha]
MRLQSFVTAKSCGEGDTGSAGGLESRRSAAGSVSDFRLLAKVLFRIGLNRHGQLWLCIASRIRVPNWG